MQDIPFFPVVSQIIMNKTPRSDINGNWVIIQKSDIEHEQITWNQLVACLHDMREAGLITSKRLRHPNINEHYKLDIYINHSFYEYLNNLNQKDFENKHTTINTNIAKKELHESKKANLISTIAICISIAALALSLISLILAL